MNIFWLSFDYFQNAKWYCDAHIGKIAVEITQMLYAAHRILMGEISAFILLEIANTQKPEGYELTHANHPMVKWVAGHPEHYEMACNQGLVLCEEHLFRYPKKDNRPHACYAHLQALSKFPPYWTMDAANIQPWSPPLCMDPECFVSGHTPCKSNCLVCRTHYVENKETKEFYSVVRSHRENYVKHKFWELTQFTYTNRPIPYFVLQGSFRCRKEKLWPRVRFLFVARFKEGNGNSWIHKTPIEVIRMIADWVATRPYVVRERKRKKPTQKTLSTSRKRKVPRRLPARRSPRLQAKMEEDKKIGALALTMLS